VFFLLRKGRRLIWNLTTLHDALAGAAGAVCTRQFGIRSWLRVMILNVPVSSDERLPDAIQVGMAIGHSRRFVGSKLSGRLLSLDRRPRQPKRGHGSGGNDG